MKRCPKCGVTKTTAEFHRRASSPDGLHHRCKACRNGDMSKRYRENRERILRTQRAAKYGLTVTELDKLLEDQGGRCAICQEASKVWHIDHNHETGKVRGVLCPGCNVGIGHLRESPEALRSAADYLEAFL